MQRSRTPRPSSSVLTPAPRHGLRQLAIGIALAAALLVPRAGAAQGVVDQSHVCSHQVFQIQFYSPVGQSFVPVKPSLNAVEVWLQDMNTPHSDTITMRLREGGIAGPVLATLAQALTVPPGSVWVRYDLPAPVQVVPGNTYVIELAATNPSWGWAASMSTSGCAEYPSGAAIGNFGVGLAARDWNFRTYTLCGDGNLDAGEECDVGAATGTVGSCCSAACELLDAGTECGPSEGACDVADVCDGVSASCPDELVPAGTSCRASSGECDPEDFCDGVGTACADDLEPGGTPCTDDGAICTTDVCDGAGACTHSPGNAGTVCRAATDVCDVTESCTGASASCPTDVLLPDADSDGACNAIDPCTSTGAQDFVARPKANLLLAKINTDTQPGNDKLNVTGAFTLPVSTPFGDLALDASGVRVVVEASDGSYPVDVIVPPGAYSTITKTGWKLSGTGKTWTFTNGSATPADGIKKVTVTDRSGPNSLRQVLVKVVGVKGTYPVVTGDAPLQAIVTLGDASAAAAGVCGESSFVAADCSFNGPGNQVRCKR